MLPPVPRVPAVSRGPTGPTGRTEPSPSTVLTARSLQFRLRPSDTAASGFNVELTVPGLDRAEAAFECDPWTEKQTREALDKIEKGECVRDDLAYVGSQLWSGMVHSGVLGQVDQTRTTDPTGFYHVRLRLPRRFDDLPWEALYDRREGFLGTSERFCVIRDLPEDLPSPPPRAGAGRPVGVLVVMPQGSGLDLATEKARIQQRAAVQETAVRVEVLENAVTPDSLRAALGRGGWDVVHFAGHAKTNDKNEVLIRLNGADDPEADHWMEAEVFASLFNATGVGLVVFNCCRAATPYVKRSLSGLGPFLLRKGVPAVIAMRYDLPDPTALRFADEFYRVLFAGQEPGRIDFALEKARVVIYQNQTDRTVRDFVTPVLFLAVGHERAFVLDPPAPPVVPPGGVAPARPAVDLPEDLLAALLEAKCVPVIGPGVLSAGALRDEAPPPGPRDLARRLAQESNYRAGTLFDLAAGAGPWIDAMLLQWVCQHFSVQRRIGFKMFNIIQQMFRTLKPSSLVPRGGHVEHAGVHLHLLRWSASAGAPGRLTAGPGDQRALGKRESRSGGDPLGPPARPLVRPRLAGPHRGPAQRAAGLPGTAPDAGDRADPGECGPLAALSGGRPARPLGPAAGGEADPGGAPQDGRAGLLRVRRPNRRRRRVLARLQHGLAARPTGRSRRRIHRRSGRGGIAMTTLAPTPPFGPYETAPADGPVGPPAAEPFKFLDYFEERDEQSFSGRTRDIQECIDRITTSRLFVIYARSGFGKTSLLKAGVFPRLRERGLRPVYVRTLQNPVRDLRAVLLADAWEHPPSDPAPRPGAAIRQRRHAPRRGARGRPTEGARPTAAVGRSNRAGARPVRRVLHPLPRPARRPQGVRGGAERAGLRHVPRRPRRLQPP